MGGDGVAPCVIPAEAGIHFDFAFGLRRENRLTSLCVSSTIHGRRLLSFACPKESNQRKGHPRGRRGIHAPATSRAGYGVRLGHIHVPCANARASMRAPLRAFPAPARRGREGPGRAKRGSPCRRSKAKRTRAQFRRPRGSGDPAPLPFRVPSKAAAKGTDQPRAPHAGGARDRADSDERPWMASWPNPSARSEPSPQARARRRGCRFLWLLSFGQAKESNWPPWMADKKHTDVSRLSQQNRSAAQGLPSPYPLPQAGEGKGKRDDAVGCRQLGRRKRKASPDNPRMRYNANHSYLRVLSQCGSLTSPRTPPQ